MAKRYTQRNMMKTQPAEMTMYFPLPGASLPQTSRTDYIDLSQVASLINRRFYRQGINWSVAGFKVISTDDSTGMISISKLPTTWVLGNSWEKSMRAWSRMNREALEETESVRPRFLDFKIYADAEHHAAGFGANLLPYSISNNLATAGEWLPSKFVIPKTDGTDNVHNREVIAVGANYPPAGASGLGAVSMIEGYAASRALPYQTDPNVPNDAASVEGNDPANWLSAIFNDGTKQDDQIMNDMISENNEAPYPFEDDGTHVDTMYPGGANQLQSLMLHDIAFVSPTTVGGTTYMKGGNFPCGLIRIDQTRGDGNLALQLLVDLVPGAHRGYHCEPMTEM